MTPESHHIPIYWRTRAQRLRMVGEECECGAKIFPPRDNCPECGSTSYKSFNPETMKYEIQTVKIVSPQMLPTRQG